MAARSYPIASLSSALVVLAVVQAAGEPERRAVTLHLIDRARLSESVIGTLQREVDALWADELSLTWERRVRFHPAWFETERVYVTLCGFRTDSPERGVLAAIHFAGETPLNQVRVYPSEAMRLLSADADVSFARRPLPVRYELLGRVLGRALAHELGHYVRQSKAHAPDGLMKAGHRMTALAGRARSPFLMPSGSARLDAPAAVSADCSLDAVLLDRR